MVYIQSTEVILKKKKSVNIGLILIAELTKPGNLSNFLQNWKRQRTKEVDKKKKMNDMYNNFWSLNNIIHICKGFIVCKGFIIF